MKAETLSGVKRVVGVVLFLVLLCLICSIGYGDPVYKYVPFATQATPQVNTQAYTNIGLRVDSSVRFVKYASDSTHFLYSDATGFLKYGSVIKYSNGYGLLMNGSVFRLDTTTIDGRYVKLNSTTTPQSGSAYLDGSYSANVSFRLVNADASEGTIIEPQYIDIKNANGGLMGKINGQGTGLEIIFYQNTAGFTATLKALGLDSNVNLTLPLASGRLALESQITGTDTTSLSNRINLRIKYSDTAVMVVTQTGLNDTVAAIRASQLIGITSTNTTALGYNQFITGNNIGIGRNDSISSGNRNVSIGDNNITKSSDAVNIGWSNMVRISKSTVTGSQDTALMNFTGNGYPTLYGYHSIGNGCNFGPNTYTKNDENIAFGPGTANLCAGGAAFGIGDHVYIMTNDGITPTTTGARRDTSGGTIAMGDYVFANGALNYLFANGCGTNKNSIICLGCQGSTIPEVAENDHECILGFADTNTIYFKNNVGYIKEYWVGGHWVSAATKIPAVYVNFANATGSNNLSGQEVIFNSSGSTGNATPTGFTFKTSDVGSSGLTAQSFSTKMTIGSSISTSVLDNYGSDLSGSYTNRSKIDKGYGTATYGTLAQQTTNTANIVTNTSNIATNTTNIASNTASLLTKWSLSGNIGSGNILGQTDNNSLLIKSGGDTLFTANRHNLTADSSTSVNTPINNTLFLQSGTKTQTISGTGVTVGASVDLGSGTTISNSSLTSAIVKVNAKNATTSGNAAGLTVVDTITATTTGRVASIQVNQIINTTSGSTTINGVFVNDVVQNLIGSYVAFETNSANTAFKQTSGTAGNIFAGKTVFGNAGTALVRTATFTGAVYISDSMMSAKVYGYGTTVGNSTHNLALYNTVTTEFENSGATMESLTLHTGTSANSGDGITTAFTIAHGLGFTPSFYNAVPTAAAAANIAYITADGTNITVNYTVAPILGTNNLTYNWSAKQ